jgi:hypothetical protein
MLQAGSAIAGAFALVAGILGYDQAFLWLAGLSVALNAISIVARGGWAADSDWPGYPPPPPPRPMLLHLQVWALLIGLAGVVAGWLGYGDVLLILTVVSVAANLLSLYFATGRRPPQAAGAQRRG